MFSRFLYDKIIGKAGDSRAYTGPTAPGMAWPVLGGRGDETAINSGVWAEEGGSRVHGEEVNILVPFAATVLFGKR